MRLRSLLLPALLVAPLFLPKDAALACFRFKKPGGAVPPGLREPKDPPPPPPTAPPTTTPSQPNQPPTTTPSAPNQPNTPPPPTPTTGNEPGPKTPGDGKKKAASDDSTWETWWGLNRIEFFPHRYVKATVSSEGPTLRGVKPLAASVVREKLWKQLLILKDDKQPFVQEAAYITIGRVASDDSLKAEARAILLEGIKHKNHLVARAAALGLFYVADESCMLPMYSLASDPKAESDVRAFLTLTLTAMKSNMTLPLLMKLVSTDKDADFELVSSAIMALGYVDGAESARTLKDIYENHKFRDEHRALAVESFGRRGSFDDGWEILSKALDDRETDIRRSAAMGLGVLDYRTTAERQIADLVEPYDLSTGASLPKDVAAKVDALKAQIGTQREKTQTQVREVVKRLVHALENDNDNFTCSMCAIALGRIAGQADESFAVKRLVADLKKERNTVREYEILALAIAKAPEAFEIAKDAVEGKNKQPTTICAGLIALGILGDSKGTEICRAVVEEAKHPMIRGYGAMAMGMIGDEKAQGPILSLLKTTKSPDAMNFGALGLALLGKKAGSEILVHRLTETTDGEVASYSVYSLGIMKDRSKIDDLVKIATDNNNFFVQSAAVAAIGYVASAEDYPKRHLMARGFDYLLNLNLLENFFYKL